MGESAAAAAGALSRPADPSPPTAPPPTDANSRDRFAVSVDAVAAAAIPDRLPRADAAAGVSVSDESPPLPLQMECRSNVDDRDECLGDDPTLSLPGKLVPDEPTNRSYSPRAAVAGGHSRRRGNPVASQLFTVRAASTST